ncbi:expressed unknown protein [Seminavis robusta]|uniref:Uncharacterized protein n=1 Tax=Seminavis robusta TaxID=568900 RepID=A0A9N8HAC4_9STRA|nr:expressed unknown protein [Seminavis robusta]|eukprot:Sro219_g090310.1 n/a (143) ;mRNA; r:12437-12983
MGLGRLCWIATLLSAGVVSDSFIMASMAGNSDAAKAAASDDTNKGDEVPQLPDADPNANIPRIKLGETISFEEMGPVILNSDGSTRRIDNWDQLTEREKEVTWRRISKRNEERRKILLAKQQEAEEAAAAASKESGEKKDEL